MQGTPTLRRWSGRPIGLYDKVADYLGVYPSRGWIKTISPGGSYERITPLPAGGPLPVQFVGRQTVSWPDEKIFWIENCRYWGYYGGSIVTHDDRIIFELSPDVWGSNRHAMLSRLRLPPLQHLSGLTAVISTPEADTNYSHWMVDLLPRIELLRQAGFGADKVDRYLVNVGRAPYHRETLNLLGIPQNKIFAVDGNSHYRCDSIVTTSHRPAHWRFCMPAWIPVHLEKSFVRNRPSRMPRRRIYLSRKDCAYRRIQNEDAVAKLMLDNGFEILEPSTISVEDQAQTFATATAIVSAHGSALTNLIFCRAGTRVVEIFPNQYFDASFWTMASAKQCWYAATTADGGGTIDDRIPYMEGQRKDVHISLKALATALNVFDDGMD